MRCLKLAWDDHLLEEHHRLDLRRNEPTLAREERQRAFLLFEDRAIESLLLLLRVAVLCVLDSLGGEDDASALALSSRTTQSLNHADRRLLRIEAYDQVNLSDI